MGGQRWIGLAAVLSRQNKKINTAERYQQRRREERKRDVCWGL